MKKILLTSIILLAFLSCCVETSDKNSRNGGTQEAVEPEPRVKCIERTTVNSQSFSLIDVDGHLYLVYYGGGIIHAESCPCKQKNDTLE